jgi:hypothetical protein
MENEITNCRICPGTSFQEVINLGNMAMTGVFPKKNEIDPPAGFLRLVRCLACNLVQLDRNFDASVMYGDTYGYMSSLNPSMKAHLVKKAKTLVSKYGITNGLVVDIGSNDGTSLNTYHELGFKTVGIDPLIRRFEKNYPKETLQLAEFFGSELAETIEHSADLITSIAMFYDLEDPNDFVAGIVKSLKSGGLWHFEQSYLPFMLNTNSFDTICHEHLEYYSLSVIKKMLEKHNMKIIDIEFNSINGGSLAVTAAKEESAHTPSNLVAWALSNEMKLGLDTEKPYRDFRDRVIQIKESLIELVDSIQQDGLTLVALGASTKGNVLLQYCGFSKKQIAYIGEVNPNKFGSRTPGSNIDIISEEDLLSKKPDFILLLPWHFKDFLMKRILQSPSCDSRVILPLPNIEIYS